MPVTYETWLVLLSIVMAIQGAYVGLSLAVQIAGAAGMRRRLLLAGATASLAVAIWTMHFVGMLAVRLPFQVDYLVLPTLLSFLICAIVVGAAVYATSSGPLTLLRLTLSACLMGGGIFTMHYIGMSALDASASMIHDRFYVAASMAIAIAASGLALWLAAGRGGRPPLILSATAFGIAVSGMHYTAMAGVSLYPYCHQRIRGAYAVDRPPGHCRGSRRILHLGNISPPTVAGCDPLGIAVSSGGGRRIRSGRRSGNRRAAVNNPRLGRGCQRHSRIWTRDLCAAWRCRRSGAARPASSHRA